MRTVKTSLLAFIMALFFIEGAKAQENLTQYIDPIIGTGGHGHTFPGAATPFGMIQLSPDNGRADWDWVSGYHYSSDYIAGFSHLHLLGTGIGDWLDIAVMPMLNPIEEKEVDTRTFFSHNNEEATAGRYRVKLDNGISADLTTTARVGYHRYTFPEGTQNPTLRLDLHHLFNWDEPIETEIKILNDTTVVGKRISTGWANHQSIFFVLRTKHPIKAVLLNGEPVKPFLEGEGGAESASTISEKNEDGVNAQLIFEEVPVEIKVALSSINTDKAIEALAEIPDWNFERVVAAADRAWEEEMAKIKIETPRKNIKRIFYTNLYHTAIAPTLYSDADGEYRNYKDEVLKAPDGEQKYTLYSLWDTFRAEHPLLTITQPEKYLSILNSMLSFYDEYGLLPVWDLSTNETNTMTGYHAVPVLADAILKDFPGIDRERAYKAMLASGHQEVREVPSYMEYGYVPQDVNGGSVTKTLEYAFDDYAIAQVAKKLGKEEDYKEFSRRAQNYRNLFDSETGFMRAKYKNGEFVENFDPFYSEHDFEKSQYIEGTAWQHSFFAPHDVRGLAGLFPDEKGLSKMLDSLFVAPSIMRGENVSPDADGFIGQYAHGNEPSHQIPYMYAYIGEHWKTEMRIRQIIESLYSDQPDGYPGNEDAGQMSAWTVWSMIGMYPQNPVGGEYVFGSPTVDKAEVTMPNGKTFTIEAENNSEKNFYIQSVTLNGKPYDKVYIHHQDMMEGGKLVFKMGPEPNKEYGKDKNSWPKSVSKWKD